MALTIRKTEPQLWTLGDEDASGAFHPLEDYDSHAAALRGALDAFNGRGPAAAERGDQQPTVTAVGLILDTLARIEAAVTPSPRPDVEQLARQLRAWEDGPAGRIGRLVHIGTAYDGGWEVHTTSYRLSDGTTPSPYGSHTRVHTAPTLSGAMALAVAYVTEHGDVEPPAAP